MTFVQSLDSERLFRLCESYSHIFQSDFVEFFNELYWFFQLIFLCGFDHIFHRLKAFSFAHKELFLPSKKSRVHNKNRIEKRASS